MTVQKGVGLRGGNEIRVIIFGITSLVGEKRFDSQTLLLSTSFFDVRVRSSSMSEINILNRGVRPNCDQIRAGRASRIEQLCEVIRFKKTEEPNDIDTRTGKRR